MTASTSGASHGSSTLLLEGGIVSRHAAAASVQSSRSTWLGLGSGSGLGLRLWLGLESGLGPGLRLGSGLGLEQPFDREGWRAAVGARAQHGVAPEGEPAGRGEVDRLRHVEAVREARVVGARESDDELPWPLRDAVDRHAARLEIARPYTAIASMAIASAAIVSIAGLALRSLGDNIATSWKSRSGARAKSEGSSARAARSKRAAAAPGTEYHVLDVPAEGTVAHANVQPRRGDARDAGRLRRRGARDVAEQAVGVRGEAAEVPRARHVASRLVPLPEARGVRVDVEVRPVLHDEILVLRLHDPPEERLERRLVVGRDAVPPAQRGLELVRPRPVGTDRGGRGTLEAHALHQLVDGHEPWLEQHAVRHGGAAGGAAPPARGWDDLARAELLRLGADRRDVCHRVCKLLSGRSVDGSLVDLGPQGLLELAPLRGRHLLALCVHVLLGLGWLERPPRPLECRLGLAGLILGLHLGLAGHRPGGGVGALHGGSEARPHGDCTHVVPCTRL
eukprot:scaffold28633_cov61-Phaeocystis_antarctica.AAC.10